jgi:MoaA/NifB/PqqE/SkfB family radical SAM enzyme
VVFAAAREVIRNGDGVRHLVLPGKEVFESAELLLGILEEFHAAPAGSRPGDISIITASTAGLRRYADRLADTPLGAVNISLDTPGSGLRSWRNNQPLLDAAIGLKAASGTELVGVNTVLTERNLAAILEIGRLVKGVGINQWTLGPLLRPQNGRMEPVLSVEQMREVIDRVIQEFVSCGLEIVFDLDVPLMRGLVDAQDAFIVGAGRWRFEYELPGAPNVMLEAGNPQPGYFFRLDWAGQIMSKEDYRWIGRLGSYGDYWPGRLEDLMGELAGLRTGAAATTRGGVI